MSAGKTKKSKSTLRRLYSRAAVLSSAVAFGGITIAQAQKDPVVEITPQAAVKASTVAETQPIPIQAAPIARSVQHHDDDSSVVPANAEFAEPEPLTEPIGAAESPIATETPADLPQPFMSDPIDNSAEDIGYAEPPPMLPEAAAFPQEPGPSVDAESYGSNPYRSEVRPAASIYSGGGRIDAAAESDPADAGPLDVGDPPPPAVDETRIDDTVFDPTPPHHDQQEPSPRFDAAPFVGEEGIGQSDPAEYGTFPPGASSASLANEASLPTPRSVAQTSSSSSDSLSPSMSHSMDQPESTGGQYLSQTAPDNSQPAEHIATSSSNLADSVLDSTGSAPPASVEAIEGNIPAIGKPGPQSMEGPQTPSVTVQKVVPQEIQVGRPAKFQIRVRNNGRVLAENVIIRDEVPAGTNFVQAAPKASRATDGAILWEVGALAPGQEVAVAVELMPISEGQIGSVATVSFQASASASTRATKPDLVLDHTGPLKALVGENVQFSIKLSNPGTGAATHVVLEEDVPAGLAHVSGKRLEYEVGTIAPGQSRHLELTLKADQAGHVINTITARADGDLESHDSVELDIVAPELQVSIEGPKRRYLDRKATFSIGVANPGSAPAHNVQLISQLPTGLKFVSTNNSGYYDQSRHAVIWSLEQLPAGEMGKAQFTAMPVETGEFQVHAEGRAESGLEARKDHALTVEGIAALFFGLADKVDPIEVGGQTTYEIKVVNQGSKAATNVQFAALVPEGMRPVGAQGPTHESVEGQRVTFAPLDRLSPEEPVIYRIVVTGDAAGDHRFRVQMTSDETTVPVIKEESTRVYAD